MNKARVEANLNEARRNLGIGVDRRDETATVFIAQALLDIIRAVEEVIKDEVVLPRPPGRHSEHDPGFS